MSGKTYKSKYQGEGGIFKVNKTASGQQYMGKPSDKKRFGDSRYLDGLFKSAITKGKKYFNVSFLIKFGIMQNPARETPLFCFPKIVFSQRQCFPKVNNLHFKCYINCFFFCKNIVFGRSPSVRFFFLPARIFYPKNCFSQTLKNYMFMS